LIKSNRREFAMMGTGAVLGTMAMPRLLEPLADAQSATSGAEKTHVPWYHRIRRIGQTNFNERDPQNADVEAWADYWASAKVDAVAAA